MAAEVPAFVREIDTLIRARYPLLYLVTWEEQRVEALLGELARANGKDLWEWTATRGLKALASASGVAPRAAVEGPDTREPAVAVQAVSKLQVPSLVLLKDFHRHLDDAVVVRAMRELAVKLRSALTTALIIAPRLTLPDELEKDVSVIDVPLPTRQELMALLRDIARLVTRNRKATVDLTAEQAEAIVAAAHGLTMTEAENAFAKAIATDNRLDEKDIRLVVAEKTQVIRKSGVLEYHPTDLTLDDVGGLTHLKAWLSRRKDAFSEAARRFGLPEPRGLLLLGVQGCGKSLTAKAIATGWKLPLIRLDMGRIYSGLVGSSEENLRKAIRVAESLAPVVLWIDELEKALAGTMSGNDTGVSARVFGALLTWMQEKTAPVFVVATANAVASLPPELMRRGRFDELFFIDLPSQKERGDILAIQLRRRGRNPGHFPVDELATRTEGFSGAELEQAVIAGLYEAFADGVELDRRHLETAIEATTPLSVTMAEDIRALRTWARGRTRPAS